MSELKVLVVDDILINQKIAVKMLEYLNIAADVASDGLQAVEMIKQHHYNMVLMDVQMPVMDGLEATRTIRAFEGTDRHTVIVALTANVMHGDRERCLESGMDDYLPKPILQKNIEDIVKKWLTPKKEPVNEAVSENGMDSAAMIDQIRLNQIKEIGDAGLLNELLTIYLDDLNQFSEETQTAIQQNNFQQIFQTSHKLKGSSANLGVESIRKACLDMEEFVQANDIAKVREQYIVIQKLTERVRKHIVETYL